ncbi:MAG: AMP-binding protein, partial [Proteobacteria bacterium]|nr:AMP-binding protein [Pseudomonadota bacterium]
MKLDKPWLDHYKPGIPAEIGELPYQNVADMMVTACQKYAQQTSFVNFGQSISYAELDLYSQQYAAYLQQHFETGDVIAIMMPNVLQYPIAVLGILRAGMIATNINPLYTPRELKHQLNDSEAKGILIIENTAASLAEVIDETGVQQVVTTTIGEMVGGLKGRIMDFVIKRVKKMVPAFDLPQAKKFKDVLQAGQKQELIKVKRSLDDIAFLQYTGGTTGVSKGAILTNRNMVSNVIQVKLWIGSELSSEQQELAITALPLYHIFALTANMLTFSYYGAKNVLITNPRDMAGFVKELGQHKFTVMTGVN